jgi:hypothetical protein
MANHLAAVTFLRGRYVFETVLTPQSGTGEDLSAEAQAAAAAFPTAKP